VTHSQRRPAWLAEAVIVAALMLLPLLFWWRLWAPAPAGQATIPAGDFTDQYYPLQLFAARELAAGRLPTWDPYINAGQPGLADIQTGFFYPPSLLPNLVLALFDLPFTIGLLTVQVVLHFSLASLFTYLFVRHLARRSGAPIPVARFAGALSALTFTYAGYLTSFPVQQLTILQTAIWLPLVLFFLDRAFQQARPHLDILLAGITLACALLAGHPQTAMYVVYASMTYGVYLCCVATGLRSSLPSEDWVSKVRSCVSRIAAYVVLPLTVGAALAAVQLVPTLGFIARSTRAGLDFEAVGWGFPLSEMVHLIYPGYFGGSPQYVGILPLILAAAAFLSTRLRRDILFWFVLGMVALVLSLGKHTFLYNVAYLLAPGFGAVRDQERIIFLFSLAMSVLAGYGALVLMQPLSRLKRKGFRRFVIGLVWVGLAFLVLTGLWYLGYRQVSEQGAVVNLFEGVWRHHRLLLLFLWGAIALFVLRLSGRVGRKWLMVLALGLVGLNLFIVNWRFNLAEPVAGGAFPETGMVRFLKEQPGSSRISSAGFLPGGASAGIVYELEDITGNTPLSLEAFRQFEEQVGSWRRWQLLNVAHVLSDRDLDGPGLERVYEEGEVKSYRVGDPLPRAWVVNRTVVAKDDQVFDLFNGEDFDPRAVAVLPPESKDLSLPGGAEAGGVAQVVEAGPGWLSLNVSPSQDGLLVVSQPYYPGWQAWVDGERVPVYRVDYLLQGVPLAAGQHRVELSYHLSPWPGILSLLVLAGCTAGIVLAYRRQRGSKTVGGGFAG
jgi:hypothetical protein